MITIKNLDFHYKKYPVFQDISLEFAPGSIYGLLGENGVGKTTLLKIIAGLLPPSNGFCSIDGVKSKERLPEMLQNIVFLPDEITLPHDLTPQRYIDQLYPFYPAYAPSLFYHLMEELEVEPDRKFIAMSYGQQKKSLIAASLSLGTNYILMDEPTNGLDIPSKSQFRSILSKRVHEQNTIIIATHQVKDVENLIDPIVILNNNEVLLNASMYDITNKIYFEYGSNKRDDALYSEMTPSGWLNVLENSSNEESAVNIEALFNAVLHNKQTIKRMFGDK